MRQDPERHRFGHYFDLPPRWRWVVWPVLGLSGAGAGLALWREEQALTVTECLPLVALPGMAALVYWFNQLVFKATQARREDFTDTPTSGEQHR